MTNQFSISVVMPAYNEEKNLEAAVLKTKETMIILGLEHEIVIVNDASTDKTKDIADKIAKDLDGVTAFHHEKNSGIGGAFRTGVENTKYDYIILVPADNPLSPADMTIYLPRMSICDIVVGFRAERVGYSAFAKFASFMYNRIFIPLLFNIGLNDVNWIQIYKRDIFNKEGIKIENNGMFFLVEVLIKARRKGLIIAEVRAHMKRRVHGKATCFSYKTIWRTFRDMIKFFIKIRNEDRRNRK